MLVGWLGLAIPLSVFLLWASWSPFYERLYLPAARVALPLLGVISAVGIACRILVGHPDPFYFLTSYSIALFFLGGQLFREALIANALMIVAHGAALAYVGEPIESVVYYVSVLTITAAVGAFVYSGSRAAIAHVLPRARTHGRDGGSRWSHRAEESRRVRRSFPPHVAAGDARPALAWRCC